MNMWVVYKDPIDFKEKYVARRFIKGKPTQYCACDNDLEKVRHWIKIVAKSLGAGEVTRVDPAKKDDKVILEIWL